MRNSVIQAGILIGMLLLVVLSLPPTGHSLDLAAVGDIMLGRGVASAHEAEDWDQALAVLAPHLADADLSFANLESPITDAPLVRETYDLRAPKQAKLALSTSGLDLLSLANNHMGDSGPAGTTNTIQTLKSVGITSVGPAETPLITQTKGIRLGWLAFDDILQPLDEKNALDAVASVLGSADLVVVSIHWGSEGVSIPNERQRFLAQELASAGADIILGHHPHVLQPVEWVWGESRARPTLVAYSLGNALFDQSAPPAARYSALLMIAVDRLGVREACVLPFQLDPTTWNTGPASPSTTETVLRQTRIKSCQ
jgi:poly-gamma-glutamate capsule biosynthesis protein CapA/YwtB (metallophosphatase superfamily)